MIRNLSQKVDSLVIFPRNYFTLYNPTIHHKKPVIEHWPEPVKSNPKFHIIFFPDVY
jgi:hypothetical protein